MYKKEENPMNEENGTYLKLAFSEIKPDPAQPRKHFCQKKIDDLAASMRVEGQILAIVVRENPDYTIGANTTRYLIVDGERRWRAAERARLPHVEALCKTFKNVSAVQMMANESEALNPVEKAEALQRRIDELSKLGESSPKMVVAREHGKSPAWVSKSLKIMSLDEEIRSLARTGKVLDMTTLQKLQKCKADKRKEAFDLIERNTFCAKAFFRRKKPDTSSKLTTTKSNSTVSNQNKTHKTESENEELFRLGLTKTQMASLFERTGYLAHMDANAQGLSSDFSEEFEKLAKNFTHWLINETLEPRECVN
jgi:ParB family transcriptional regulator, chromosome partitioning protein